MKMRPEKMALWNTYLPNINQTVVEQLPAETTSLPPQPCTINMCGPGKCSLNSRELILGSLSNSVFERRTSTGSGLFASLGSGSVENLG